MQAKEWREELGKIVREWIQTPEIESFHSVKFTRARAKLYLSQLNLYVRNRRNCWAQVMANCPVIDVKKRILEHEYEELVKDDYSDKGHLDLVVRQANELGFTEEEIYGAEPIAITTAATQAWLWIAYHRPWHEALVASSSMEWENDNRLLDDIGGGTCVRLLKTWERDLKLCPEQMPTFLAHSKADERHSDMFLEMFERHIPTGAEEAALRTAKDSYDIFRAYFEGLGRALARIG